MDIVINPAKDQRVVLDQVFYTTEGAMKVIGIGRTALSREIKEKRISVFKHPSGNLFSKEALNAWIINRTSKGYIRTHP